MSAPQPGPQPSDPPPTARPLPPAQTDTRRIIVIGSACWLVALVVTLVVPGLHTGARGWWPWACLTGLALGGAGLLSVRRRR